MNTRSVPRSLKDGLVNTARSAAAVLSALPQRPGPPFGVEKRTVHRHARWVKVGPPFTDEGQRRSGVHRLRLVPRRDLAVPVRLSHRRLRADQRSSRPTW